MSAEEHQEAQRLANEWDAAVESEVDRDARGKLKKLVDHQANPTATSHFAPDGAHGGGYVGDATRSAVDLLQMAILLTSGDRVMRKDTRAFLEKARHHQLKHIARLEDAMAAPRKRASHEMWKATHGRVKSTDARAQENLLLRAQSILDQIRSYAAECGPNGLASLREVERQKARLGHETAIANYEFGQLLRDGKLSVAHRFASLVAERSGSPQISSTLATEGIAENMENAARIARAVAAAEPNEAHWPLRDLRNATDRYMAQLLSARQAGEAINKRGSTEGPRLERATSADQVFRVAHAMRRNLDTFRTSSRSMEHGAKMRIPASVDALRELREQKMGTEVWDRMVLSDRPATYAGGKRSIWAEAHMSVRVGEQDVDLIVEAYVGSTTLRNKAKQNAWLQEHATRMNATDVILNLPVVKEPEMLTREGQPRIEPRENPGDGPRPRGRDTLADLIGRDECRHESAEWVAANGGSHIHDTARLECRKCHRPRVAAFALHRLPKDHPVRVQVLEGEHKFRDEPGAPTLSNEQRYLMRERYHAALRDDARPIEDLEQLTARDGLIDLDPTHYAIGFGDDAPGKVAPRRQVRSIRDAMMRR